MSVMRLFYHAESSPFYNSQYLYTLLFLSKQTLYGRKIALSFSFCVYLVVLNVYRASNVWGDDCKSSCLVLQLEYAMYLERWRAASNEAERSVSAVMKRHTITSAELNTFHLYQNYSLFMHNKIQYT